MYYNMNVNVKYAVDADEELLNKILAMNQHKYVQLFRLI